MFSVKLSKLRIFGQHHELKQLTWTNFQKFYSPKFCSLSPDPPKEQEDEENVDSIRNISRLPSNIRAKMDHVLHLNDYVKVLPKRSLKSRRTFNRQLYAYYGKKSGIPPNVMWASKEELETTIEDENQFEPSFHSMVQKMKEQKLSEVEEQLKKEQLVETQMAKMPQLIDNYKLKLQKLKKEAEQQELRSKALLEEARDFYGYKMDTKDPRYKQFVLAKKEEEKNVKKKLKKQKLLQQQNLLPDQKEAVSKQN